MENELQEIKEKVLLPGINYNAIDAFVDMLGIYSSLRKDLEKASLEERKKFFKFFLWGVVFTLGSVYMSLFSLGIIIPFWTIFTSVATICISLGFAFVWGKNKEIVYQILNNDPTNLLDSIKAATMKLVNKSVK